LEEKIRAGFARGDGDVQNCRNLSLKDLTGKIFCICIELIVELIIVDWVLYEDRKIIVKSGIAS